MDGIHDLGGMHGFGGIERAADEPVFHARWEARMFALASAAPFAVAFGDDQFRPAIEAITPQHYLASSYYEKWYVAVRTMLVAHGAVTAAELSGGPVNVPPLPAKPLPASRVAAAIAAGPSQALPGAMTPRFAVGDRVRTRAHFADGHNRLPRYARGKTGRIDRRHGAFLVADDNARGIATAETLYTVVFAATELWGADADPADSLCLDLWDRYLEWAT